MLKKIIHTFGIRAFSAVVNLLVAILLSQYLGPEGKGTQAVIITTISFILIFTNLVGGATLVYLTPRFPAFQLLIPSYVWTILMSLLAYPVLALTHLVGQPFILHVCLLSVINSLMSIHSNVLIGNQRIKESNHLVTIQTVLLIGSLAFSFLILHQASVQAYLISLYISIGASMLVSTVFIRKSYSGFALFPVMQFVPVLIQMFRFGFQNQVAHITQMLSFRLSIYVLEARGLAAVGVYSNGISIAESIWLVAKSMSLVQYSWVSNSSDRMASAKLTIQLVKVGVVASMLLIIPLLILPVSGYTFIFGNGFAGVKPVIWTLLPGVLIYNFSILFGHYYSGTGRYHVNTLISSLGLAVSVVLYYSLIPRYSIIGAGYATSLSYMFTSLLFLWYFSKEYKGWARELLPRVSDFRSVYQEIRKSVK